MRAARETKRLRVLTTAWEIESSIQQTKLLEEILEQDALEYASSSDEDSSLKKLLVGRTSSDLEVEVDFNIGMFKPRSHINFVCNSSPPKENDETPLSLILSLNPAAESSPSRYFFTVFNQELAASPHLATNSHQKYYMFEIHVYSSPPGIPGPLEWICSYMGTIPHVFDRHTPVSVKACLAGLLQNPLTQILVVSMMSDRVPNGSLRSWRILRNKSGSRQVPPCLRAKQFSRPGEAPFGHRSYRAYSALSNNRGHNSVLTMQRKRELCELLTILSASSAMLGVSPHTRLELEHFIFADGDNDDHHRTAAFLTRTNTGFQVLATGQTEIFGMNTELDALPLTVSSICSNGTPYSNPPARNHSAKFDINWHASSFGTAHEVEIHFKLRTNLRLDLARCSCTAGESCGHCGSWVYRLFRGEMMRNHVVCEDLASVLVLVCHQENAET
ncbi:hypothetical protein BDR07DRAFT_1558980 [Suillus spraguei]|nr:hypothetical protein BDR07DRAFT_1558980 [Suillus spraguei]